MYSPLSIDVIILRIYISDFTEDDRPMRMDNSVCDSPSGSGRVRDALVVVSFVLIVQCGAECVDFQFEYHEVWSGLQHWINQRVITSL